MFGQTNKQTDGQRKRQKAMLHIFGWTNKQTDRQRNRWTDEKA